MTPRLYMASIAVLGGLLLSLIAGLNLAMDPYGVGEGSWSRIRPSGWSHEQDRMPDRGLSGRIATARRGGADILLVGTSRTLHGFAPAGGRLNAGLTNAALEEQLAIVRAAGGSADPPDRVLIETATVLTVEPGRRRFLTPPTLAERLFSTAATETSLRLMRAPDGYDFPARPDVDAEAWRRAMSSRPLTTFGKVRVQASLDQAVAELRDICRRGGGRMVIYEPPVAPALLQAPEVRTAVSARIEAYGAAIRRTTPGLCRPVFADLSGLNGQAPPAAKDPARWYDNIHFKPVLGEEILRTLLVATAAAR